MSVHIGKDGKRMILIPAGFFLMGTSDADLVEMEAQYGWKREWFADEMPQRRVYLDAYYIDEMPVTNADYKKFLDAGALRPVPENWDKRYRSYMIGASDHPVTCVSWDDANAYAVWAGKRLPTEAEWEKAARGTDGRWFPWGNRLDVTRFNSRESNVHGTTPVNQFSPRGDSPFGVMDVVGNVSEWCADWYAEDYFKLSPDRNPRGPASGDWRVLRGGAWDAASDLARCASRDYISPESGYATVGFRCAGSVR
ncbi:MAG: SUMF1/EgtB/PvdO family nonheme iron enzyme [Chloroflexi bacterium]|nr:SUMF1/EgtB/PvdO family nonheme iron enzyme [Chloroflexota bacterium]